MKRIILTSAEEMIGYIENVGILPYFECGIMGFSVESLTRPSDWWTFTGDDPWVWREIAARDERIAYGKFFHGKAGFISKAFFPEFANYRRDGYDFDAAYEDGKANRRCKAIMDLFEDEQDIAGYRIKKEAGFGKDGEKNFSGTITDLQMRAYLIVSDFRQKTNKKGEPYGMSAAHYVTPEYRFGEDHIAKGYEREPAQSFDILCRQIVKVTGASEKTAKMLMK